MQFVYPRCCGLDVHKKSLAAARSRRFWEEPGKRVLEEGTGPPSGTRRSPMHIYHRSRRMPRRSWRS